MQAPSPTARANRIPRIPSAGGGLSRRLHRLTTRLQLWRARRHLAELQAERRELQHLMAMDQAALAAHRVQYLKSPVLQARVAEDQAMHQHLGRLIAAAAQRVSELESAL